MYTSECYWWSGSCLARNNYFTNLPWSRTLTWPQPSAYIRIFSNLLPATFPRNQIPWSNTIMPLGSLWTIQNATCLSHCCLCCIPLHFPLPTYFLAILRHHLFFFSHILLWLPWFILLIHIVPFHFVFPTGSLRAWFVISHSFDDTAWGSVTCMYGCRRWPPGDPSVVCAVNFEPTDINCVIDCAVIWEV